MLKKFSAQPRKDLKENLMFGHLARELGRAGEFFSTPSVRLFVHVFVCKRMCVRSQTRISINKLKFGNGADKQNYKNTNKLKIVRREFCQFYNFFFSFLHNVRNSAI